MSNLLENYLAANLIEQLAGDDTRFTKISQAAASVAAHLRQSPKDLIPAILAGTDPEVPDDDPSIDRAYRALLAEWKSLNSVYPSRPTTLLRAILVAACEAAAAGPLVSIPWLTAVDILPFRRLGREELVIARLMAGWATAAETAASDPDHVPNSTPASTDQPEAKLRKVDQAKLQRTIAAAVGPQDKASQPLPAANPHWPNAGNPWSWEYYPRMATILASEFDALAQDQSAEMSERIAAVMASIASRCQIPSVPPLVQLQIQTVSWSHALYSASTRRSYRSMTPHVAAVVMAADLLDLVTSLARPVPASIGYILSEAVARLGEAAVWQRTYPVITLLEASAQIPTECLAPFLRMAPVAAGRSSLRDLVSVSLSGTTPTSGLLGGSGLRPDAQLSLPAWAHALFRQGLAVHLATRSVAVPAA